VGLESLRSGLSRLFSGVSEFGPTLAIPGLKQLGQLV
jgi:hypothetical protein